MLYHLNIRYPEREIDRNRERLDHAQHFQSVDRVPVILGIEARYILRERGVTFAEYFSDPKTQFIHLLENFKWRVENIPDDFFVTRAVSIAPDFQNVVNASACGCEVRWFEDGPPRAIPFLHSIDEMVRYEKPDCRSGLWGKRLEWYHEMKKLAEQTEVTLNGERIPIDLMVSINGDSPFGTAVDMAGERFYLWLHEAPEECKALLSKITGAFLEAETQFRRILGKPINSGFILSDDPAQVISTDMYREFCVPYDRKLYSVFGCDGPDGRSMHMCGRNVHLHEPLVKDLRITKFHGYGSENTPEEMRETMAGKVVLHGNIDPVLLYQGMESDIESATWHLLEVLAPYGGIVVTDGYNVAPGTPLTNLAVVKRTSEKFGPVERN